VRVVLSRWNGSLCIDQDEDHCSSPFLGGCIEVFAQRLCLEAFAQRPIDDSKGYIFGLNRK